MYLCVTRKKVWGITYIVYTERHITGSDSEPKKMPHTNFQHIYTYVYMKESVGHYI